MRALLNRSRTIFTLYVALSVAQVMLLTATGTTSGFSLGHLIPGIVLIVGLGRRSRLAWWLLVAFNVVPLLFTTLLLGPGVIWTHVVLFVGSSLVLLALLVSRPMRAYVAAGGPRRPVGRTGRRALG